MASADLRVPMWMVAGFSFWDAVSRSDWWSRERRGAVSLDDFSWVFTVGSRREREEVDSFCSWVAILNMKRLKVVGAFNMNLGYWG